MDLFFHKNKIIKFEKEYQKPYLHRLKILTWLLAFHFVFMMVMIGFIIWGSLIMLIPIGVFVLYNIFAFYHYVKIYRANKICKEEFYRLIAMIVHDNLEVDVAYLKDDPRFRQMVKDTRLVNNYDAIGVYKTFSINLGGVSGLILDVNATRSQGKSTVTILRGVVYVFDTECSTNMQIRNDVYRGAKCQKERELSTSAYSIYSFDGKKNFFPSPNYVKKFTKINSISPQAVTAIDFQPNKISIYVKRKNVLKIPRVLSDTNMLGCCSELYAMVSLGREMSEILIEY